jgi:hypothetical protein
MDTEQVGEMSSSCQKEDFSIKKRRYFPTKRARQVSLTNNRRRAPLHFQEQKNKTSSTLQTSSYSTTHNVNKTPFSRPKDNFKRSQNNQLIPEPPKP